MNISTIRASMLKRANTPVASQPAPAYPAPDAPQAVRDKFRRRVMEQVHQSRSDARLPKTFNTVITPYIETMKAFTGTTDEELLGPGRFSRCMNMLHNYLYSPQGAVSPQSAQSQQPQPPQQPQQQGTGSQVQATQLPRAL